MKGPDGDLELDFFASELRLRGDAPVVQPHEKAGNVFCWNGEVCSLALLYSNSMKLIIFTF